MAGINNVTLIGRLTRDPEIRKTQSGQSVCTFTIAVDRVPAKDGTETADFPACVAWSKTAEILAQYAHKGSLIGVAGSIQTRNYEDKDGRKVYVTEVNARQIQLLDSRQESTGQDYMRTGNSWTKDEISREIHETETLSEEGDVLPF